MLNPEIMHFLMDLQENNNREWFQENKPRYDKVKEDFNHFVDALIRKISEYDPSVKGLEAKDCMFRIYRDVRFSKNKEPYKNNIGAYIAQGGRKSIKAGYYLHIEPGASMLAGGLYCPDSKVLKQVRQDIADHEEEFRGILNNEDFKSVFGDIDGDKLKTAPRGFAKDHPALDLLRFKSYTYVKSLSEDDLMRENLLDQLADMFRHAKAFNDFINHSVAEV